MAEINPLGHVCYKIANATPKQYPFPHIFVENVFPEKFYDDIQELLPSSTEYSSGSSNYNGRKFCDPSKSTIFDFLNSETFTHAAIAPFRPYMAKRFPTGQFLPHTDLRLILDSENYAIGPHTDAPWKVLSFLFYLPINYSFINLGTSIYLPKDPSFRCSGGPHHKFDNFNRIYTAPFIPNSCFAFFKTDYSFHGVEPIQIRCRRDVLLWNLYDRNLKQS